MIREGEHRFFGPDDSESTVIRIIGEPRRLGEGFYGVVYEITAAVKINDGEEIRSFVVKKYKGDSKDLAQKLAQSALQNHRMVKEAGLKTWETYLIGHDKDEQEYILMTSGHDEFTACVSYNPQHLAEEYRPEPFANFPGKKFRELAKTTRAQALKAAKCDIAFERPDVFFFLMNKQTQTVDVVIGDLDRVAKADPSRRERTRRDNLSAARTALTIFVNVYLTPPETYRPIVDHELPER